MRAISHTVPANTKELANAIVNLTQLKSSRVTSITIAIAAKMSNEAQK
jgi:hypothetical protein